MDADKRQNVNPQHPETVSTASLQSFEDPDGGLPLDSPVVKARERQSRGRPASLHPPHTGSDSERLSPGTLTGQSRSPYGAIPFADQRIAPSSSACQNHTLARAKGKTGLGLVREIPCRPMASHLSSGVSLPLPGKSR